MFKLLIMKNILFTLALLVSSCGNDTKSDDNSEMNEKSNSSIGVIDANVYISKINIEKPEGWFDNNSDNAVVENIKKIQNDGYKSDAIVDDWNNKQAKVLYFYTKYDVSTHYGVSPTINATLIKNIYNKTLEDIFYEGELLMEQFKTMGMEEVHLERIGYINLKSGIKAVEIKSSFKLPGFTEKVNSSLYSYFVSKDLILQLSFSDLENDRCDEIYKEILENF